MLAFIFKPDTCQKISSQPLEHILFHVNKIYTWYE